MKRVFLFIVWLIAAASTLRTVQAATNTEHQIWTSTFLQTRPLTKLRLLGWLDLHDRRRGASTLLIVRPALGVQVADRLAIHAGYAWVPTYVDEGSHSHEHRTWQQFVWNAYGAGAWALSFRPRAEQRFVQDASKVGHRGRLMARATYLASQSSGVLLILSNEFFYQLNTVQGAMAAGFDQNRFFAGVGIPTALGVRFEVGYLNVFLNRTPLSHLDHNLAVNAFWTY